MDLKMKAVTAALRFDEDLYHNTRNPRHVWHAWRLARQMKVSVPDWVLRFVDTLAASEIMKRSRDTDTADRYEAALTEMDAAVDSRFRLLVGQLAYEDDGGPELAYRFERFGK